MDSQVPPPELVDPTPDKGDIPPEIEESAEEGAHDVSDD
jgi:hypothetical protein